MSRQQERITNLEDVITRLLDLFEPELGMMETADGSLAELTDYAKDELHHAREVLEEEPADEDDVPWD